MKTYLAIETKEYSKFKFLKGNRDINESHVKRLMISFQIHYLLTILIVNDHFEIIDGQHRFLAAKYLGLPIIYLIKPEYGVTEVKKYHENFNKWGKKDILESCVNMGIIDYVRMKEFMLMFPEFPLTICESFLTGRHMGSSSHFTAEFKDGKKRVHKKTFEDGAFKIKDYDQAVKYATYIRMFKPYFKDYPNGMFCKSLMSIISVDGFDIKRLIRKVQLKQHLLHKCGDVPQYRELFNHIYNIGEREHNYLELRNLNFRR